MIQQFNQELPFGGVGMSGTGRYHGEAGFNECSNFKSVIRKFPLNFWAFTLENPPFT
jgi:aldehyde dehydrogenase (NAD+)